MYLIENRMIMINKRQFHCYNTILLAFALCTNCGFTRSESLDNNKFYNEENPATINNRYAPHILEMEWTISNGWSNPRIIPIHYLSLHPFSKIVKLASGIADTTMCIKNENNTLRVLSMSDHMNRFSNFTNRLALPSIDPIKMKESLIRYLKIERDSLPYVYNNKFILIRSMIIGTEENSDFDKPSKALFYIACEIYNESLHERVPIKLYSDPRKQISFHGGLSDIKTSPSYGLRLPLFADAKEMGYDDILIVHNNNTILESTVSNIFVVFKGKDKRLILTPPADDLIVSGITRKVILEMAKEWNDTCTCEREITFDDLRNAYESQTLLEIFQSSAKVLTHPVSHIYNALTNELIEISPQNDPIYLRILKYFDRLLTTDFGLNHKLINII